MAACQNVGKNRGLEDLVSRLRFFLGGGRRDVGKPSDSTPSTHINKKDSDVLFLSFNFL